MTKPSANSKIYVAGHRGLAGSAAMRRLAASGYTNLLTRAHAELDLTVQHDVEAFFEAERPEYVVLAAARVGGILANSTYPADFIQQNLAVQTNVIESAHRNGVKKLVFLGSSCIYPKHAPQPMREEYLLTGPLEPTNEAYAIAKIAGLKMCAAYHRQYGANFISLMPTNLYGPGDNYDLANSHVLPALIRKCHLAKTSRVPGVEIWGTGSPRREFLYSDDLGAAIVFALERLDAADAGEALNVGAGKDISIRELAELVSTVVGFKGRLDWDASKPDGTPRKLLDVSRAGALGWKACIPLEEGIRLAYSDFLGNPKWNP